MNLVKNNLMSPSANVFDSLFDDFFNSGFSMGNSLQPRFTEPMVNITELKDSFKIELAVPGVKKEAIQLEVDNDRLIVSATEDKNSEKADKNFSKKEFDYESFSKSFYLPESVDVNKINAAFKHGILIIELKKKEEAIDNGPQHIEIK